MFDMPEFHTILVGNKELKQQSAGIYTKKENYQHGKKDLFDPKYFLWTLCYEY